MTLFQPKPPPPPCLGGYWILSSCSFIWLCIICITKIHLPINADIYFATFLLVIYLHRSYSSWGNVYFISLVLFSGDIVFEDSIVEFESARFDWNLCLQGYFTLFGSSSPWFSSSGGKTFKGREESILLRVKEIP